MQETMLRAGTKYKVAYSTFITMPDGRRKEIITFSTKGMANHSTGMMKKSRDAIHSQVEELGLDVRLGLGAGPLYMETDVFWNYLWVFAEHVKTPTNQSGLVG